MYRRIDAILNSNIKTFSKLETSSEVTTRWRYLNQNGAKHGYHIQKFKFTRILLLQLT